MFGETLDHNFISRIQENTSLRVLLVCLLALDISAVIGCVSAAVVTAILPSFQLPSDKVIVKSKSNQI